MDIAGLTIAVFVEVFDICMFITQTIADAAHHDDDFKKLQFDFVFQQDILQTFFKRFIDGKLIHKIEELWIYKIKVILDEIKKVVGEYRRVAEKYHKPKNAARWWKLWASDREGLVPEVAGTNRPATPSKKSQGVRNRFSRKLTQLEWALFDHQRLQHIVDDQKSWMDKLIQIMTCTLFLYSSQDVSQVQDLDKDAKTLGFTNLIRRRLLILEPNRGGPTLLEHKNIICDITQPFAGLHSTKPTGTNLLNATLDGSEILIEYKAYPMVNTQMDLLMTEERIRFLSSLLGVEVDKTDVTHNSSLNCRGYFHEPEKFRFGLAFDLPLDHDRVPISLNSGITTLTRDSRPSLGQRFEIAYTTGYAIMEWFFVGWVHKSISSHNVYFFRKTGEEWDFSSAFLGGFEYARPAQEKSNEAFSHADFQTNVYRHPARHGVPSEGFKRIHDIYAFGVLLLEIGLWTVASSRELFRDENQKPDTIRETLIRNARGRLGHFMGQKYRDAVLFCLEGTLSIGEDDEKQTKLIAAFKEKVLDVCEEGRKLL